MDAEQRRRPTPATGRRCCRRRRTPASCRASGPRSSSIVMKSAMAWQGCEASERALMTGIVAERASSSTVACEKVRAARTSIYWLKTLAKSTTLSRTPKPDVLAVQEDGVSPQASDRGLEADAGAERGLLEEQPEGPARQDGRAPARLLVALDRDRLIDQPACLGRRDLQQVQEMTWHSRVRFKRLPAATHPPGWRSPRRSGRR